MALHDQANEHKTQGTVKKMISKADQFGREIDDLYEKELADVGQADLDRMRRLVKISRFAHDRGRRWMADADNPERWAKGVIYLAAHYVMEFSNGHVILHGAFDNLPGSELQSKTWRWNQTMVEDDWRPEHNQYHHTNTNVIGEDHDFGFLLFRLSEKQEWRPWNLFQLIGIIGLPLIATPYKAYFVTTARALSEGRPITFDLYKEPALRVLADAVENLWEEPKKAGARFPQVLAGNYVARLLADICFVFMLAVEHLNDELATYDEMPDDKPGEFYLRQILSTLNYHIGSERYEDLLFGGVNIHMEHHLFPNMPANRLRKLSYKIEEICRRYDVPYKRVGMFEAVAGLLATGLKYSFPWTKSKSTRFEDVWERMTRPFLEVVENETNTAVHSVLLAKSGRTLQAQSDKTLLESLREAGVEVPTGCEKGACKSCATKKLSGKTSLERKRLLDSVTVCIAKPCSDIELDL